MNLKELIAYAKKNPGMVNYGTSGVGGSPHLAAELLSLMAGIKMTQIPYKGGGPSVTAAIGGEIHLVLASTTAVTTHVKSGKVLMAGGSDPADVSLEQFTATLLGGLDKTERLLKETGIKLE